MKQKNNNQKRRLNMEAPLLDDYIFKRTFTKQGTEPLLKDFLEEILEKKLKVGKYN